MPSEDYERSDELVHLFKELPGDEDENKNKSPLSHYLISSIVLLFGVCTLPTASACAQALGEVVPPFELNMWRHLAELVLVTPLFFIKGCEVKPEWSDVMWLLLASLMSSSYNLFYFTASLYLPLAAVSGMDGTFALVILSLVTLVFDRKCTTPLALSVFLALAGTISITQPDTLFHGHSTIVYSPVCVKDSQPVLNKTWHQFEISTQDFISLAVNFTVEPEFTTESLSSSSSWSPSSSSSSTPNQLIGYALVLGGSISFCIQSNVINRKLSNVNFSVVLFFDGVIGVAVSVVLMAVFEHLAFPTSSICILLLLGHAVGQGVANVCCLRSYQVFQPTIVALVFRLCLIVSFVAQRTVLKSINPGNANSLEIVGVLLILLGNSINPVYQLYVQYNNKNNNNNNNNNGLFGLGATWQPRAE